MSVPAASSAPPATLEALRAEGAVLCVRLGEGEPALELARAAVRGGLRAIEVTLTTPGALDAIRALAEEPGAIPGAGTVLDSNAVARVAEAGGRFVLSPVFDPEVLEAAQQCGLLAVPGAATPTEIVAAWQAGAPLVKVFPAAALGGPGYLRAVRGPLPRIPLLPTNGPTSGNLAEYLEAGASLVGIGSEVVAPGRSPAEVEAAARRVRSALDAARAAGSAAGSPVSVETPSLGADARGIACAWEGGQLVMIAARRGLLACGILDPAVCERFGFAVAMAHGTPEAPLAKPEDLLAARVDQVTEAARALGIREGMRGAEVLERLR